jgi:hypothetical protein
MGDPADDVKAVLSELLPIKAENATLRLRPAPEQPPPGAPPPLASAGGVTRDAWGIFAALELTVPWREHPARPTMIRTLTDTIGLVPAAALHDMERVLAYLQGWASAVRRVLSATLETSPHGILLFRLAMPVVLDLTRGKSAERFERALLAPTRLGRYILPDPSLLSQEAVNRVYATLNEVLPASSGRFTLRMAEPLEPVSSTLPSNGSLRGVPEGLRLSLELVALDRPGGAPRDIKQQDVFLIPIEALRDPARIDACLRGWGEALCRLFATSDPEALECLMPYDLIIERALQRPRLTTLEEFRDALLAGWNRRWALH